MGGAGGRYKRQSLWCLRQCLKRRDEECCTVLEAETTGDNIRGVVLGSALFVIEYGGSEVRILGCALMFVIYQFQKTPMCM